MIALITSTLKPSSIYSIFNKNERYEQTIFTITQLKKVGFEHIYLLDNSLDNIDINKIKYDCDISLNVLHSPQYSFNNKGLNEALLILNHIHLLPHSTHIFKISARYFPNENFNINNLIQEKYDFIGVGENFDKKTSAFSTRSYSVKNKLILEKTLVLAIEEMLSYHKGIYGIRSMLSHFKSIFKISLGCTYQLSIEQAFARVLKENHNYLLLDKIHIEGIMAGFDTNNIIKE